MANKFILLLAVSLIAASTAVKAEDVSSIVRGGQLYDKWFAVIGAEKPSETHPAWPSSNTKKKGNATHRCKSCHGWDLMGKDGAYASGSYKTGIKGLKSFEGAPAEKIIAAMNDSTHGFAGKMSDQDFADIANFVSNGQVDMDAIIDRKTKLAKGGDADKGAAYYNTVCAGCHAKDGKEPKDMPALGGLSHKNPWEVVHKIRNGQPDENMPAMGAFDLQVTVDILSHLQTLPKE
jgi:mono/diheme cytochrome c family protein